MKKLLIVLTHCFIVTLMVYGFCKLVTIESAYTWKLWMYYFFVIVAPLGLFYVNVVYWGKEIKMFKVWLWFRWSDIRVWLRKVFRKYNTFGLGIYVYQKGFGTLTDGTYTVKMAMVVQIFFWKFEFIFQM